MTRSSTRELWGRQRCGEKHSLDSYCAACLIDAERWLGSVYFIEWDSSTLPAPKIRIKIGFTRLDPKIRYRHLVDELRRILVISGREPRGDVEDELRILSTIKGSIEQEKMFHARFSDHALGYEWFDGRPVRAWLNRTGRI